ncbi:alpha/beta hydrolase, partial [Streptomyces sp. MCAF7]
MDISRSALRAISAAFVAVALLLAGCTSGAASPRTPSPSKAATRAALAAYYEQKLSWHACRGGAGFECATLKAPLDYA